MKLQIVLTLAILFSITPILALSCSPTFFTETYNESEIPIDFITITNCNNLGGNTTNIILTGDSKLSLYENTIGDSQKDIKIKLDSSIQEGNYPFSLSFDSQQLVSGIFTITSYEPQSSGCRLIELPHTTSYRIKQDDTGSSAQIRIKVSNECSGPMSMAVTEDTQMAKPMFLQGSSGEVQPGDEFSFTIGLDATGVSTGTYNNRYIVSGSLGDEIFQKEIPLSVIVTIGDSPINDDTFTTLPSCNLDSDMSLNNTYSLICNNENPNIEIEVPYNNYFQGMSVSESDGKFEYKLKPIKIGTSTIQAIFKYKGVSIGNPFEKEVRVMQGSTPLMGTELEVIFYQAGTKITLENLAPINTTILVKDDNTDSIVPTFTAYLNGEVKESTFELEPEKVYELIIDSPGYLSKTLNFTLNKSDILITLIPDKTFYEVGETINITTNVGANLLLENEIITSPYQFKTFGTKMLKAVKEGYITKEMNLTIKSKVSYDAMTPEHDKWKKGKKVIIELTESASWEVKLDGNIIKEGVSSEVEFKIEEYGEYSIYADGVYVIGKSIEKSEIFSWDYIKTNWVWFVVGIMVIGGGSYVLLRNGKEHESSMGFATAPING